MLMSHSKSRNPSAHPRATRFNQPNRNPAPPNSKFEIRNSKFETLNWRTPRSYKVMQHCAIIMLAKSCRRSA